MDTPLPLRPKTRTKFRRKKTKNLYMFQSTSIYEGEYEQALEDYEDKSIDWLRLTLPRLVRHTLRYPSVAARARLDALVAVGKKKKKEKS